MNDDTVPLVTQQIVDSMATELRQLRRDMQKQQMENKLFTGTLVDQVGRLKKVVTRQNQALDELLNYQVENIKERLGIPKVTENEIPSQLRQSLGLVNEIYRDLSNDIEKLNPLYERHFNTSEDDAMNGAGDSGDLLGMAYGVQGYNRRGSMGPAPISITGAGGDRWQDIWGDRKPHILLVEDETVAAKIAQRRLQRFNCTYDYAVCLISATIHSYVARCGQQGHIANSLLENWPRCGEDGQRASAKV